MPPLNLLLEKLRSGRMQLKDDKYANNELDENFNIECSGAVIDENKSRMTTFLFVPSDQLAWRNIFLFVTLHLLHIYGLYLVIAEKKWNTWIFSYIYGFWGGLGITAGAHRLWAHKSYEARLPLRIFLCIGQCIAGQNDLYTWCRDHRVHHKYSETDADPHNSRRGYFFAHMGWLLTKKHPDVMTKGNTLDFTDLLRDPVIRFQKRYYIFVYFIFCFIIPTLMPIYLWNENWWYALLIAGFTRYTTSLHCTWFVNSTAHLFGNRPYNMSIQPRQNSWVSFGAFGEGYHNYHHTFPWDYATNELETTLNLSKKFIDAMSYIGLAYNLRKVDKTIVERRKYKVAQYLAGN